MLERGRSAPYHRRYGGPGGSARDGARGGETLAAALLGGNEPLPQSAADLIVEIRPAASEDGETYTWHWSGGVQIDRLGETAMHVHKAAQQQGEPPLVLHVVVTSEQGSLSVLIRQQEQHDWLGESALDAARAKRSDAALAASSAGSGRRSACAPAWALLPKEAALFELVNDAPCKLRYWQLGNENDAHILSLLPGERVVHGWDEPTQQQCILVQPVMQRGQKSVVGFNLNRFGASEILIAGGLARLVGTVETDGPTRVLRFTFKHVDRHGVSSAATPARRRGDSASAARGETLGTAVGARGARHLTTLSPWRVTLEVASDAGLGLSLVSRRGDEIVYGCAEGASDPFFCFLFVCQIHSFVSSILFFCLLISSFACSSTLREHEGVCLEFFFDGIDASGAERRLQFEAAIGALQIDCHLQDTVFPVVLEPVRPGPWRGGGGGGGGGGDGARGGANGEAPFVHVILCWRDHGTHVLIERFVVELQKMALRVDQALVTGLLVFSDALKTFAGAAGATAARGSAAAVGRGAAASSLSALRASARAALHAVHDAARASGRLGAQSELKAKAAAERRYCFERVLLRPIGEFSFMYRYSLRESCSQFDSLPLTSLAMDLSRARLLRLRGRAAPARAGDVEGADQGGERRAALRRARAAPRAQRAGGGHIARAHALHARAEKPVAARAWVYGRARQPRWAS